MPTASDQIPSAGPIEPRRRHLSRGTILVVVALLLAVDAFVPPRYQPTAWILRGAIRVYQVTLSPLLGASRIASCRFQPTCSRYAAEAIRKHGTWKGSAKATWRVLRCNPWGGSGWDPP